MINQARMNVQDKPLVRMRTKQVRIRQVDGDDGYQWGLYIAGVIRYSGMTKSEASWRRKRYIDTGEL